MASENTRSTALYFVPDIYPDDTLKAFNEYIQLYELRYDAQYPDPPKVSQRWKLTAEAKDMKIDLEQYDAIREEWWSKDEVSKMLGMLSHQKGCMKIGKWQNQTTTNERRQVGQILCPKCRSTISQQKTSP